MGIRESTFVPANLPARCTQGLHLALAAVSAAGIASGIAELNLMSRVATQEFTEAEADANDSRQQFLRILVLAAWIAAFASFLLWFYRAHRNLPTLAARRIKYSPRWAVGSFFVPVLNFARPFQVMCEVWHGSNPATLERDLGQKARIRLAVREETPPLVGWWWGTFVASALVGAFIARLSSVESLTLDQFQTLSTLRIVDHVLEIPTCLLAFRLVGSVTSWQSQRAELLREKGALPLVESSALSSHAT